MPNYVSKFKNKANGKTVEIEIKDSNARNLIAQEITDRDNAVKAEATARENADSALQTSIDNEISDRKALIKDNDGNAQIEKTLQYGSVTPLNNYFGTVGAKDGAGSLYQLLVGTDSTKLLGTSFVYNFKTDLGATGDGSTDDSEAFKKLPNYTGYLYIPAGTYINTAEVRNIANLTILLHPNATVMCNNTGGNLHFTNCCVYGGTFDETTHTVKGGALIHTEGGCHISCVNFNGRNTSRICVSAQSDTIEHCTFDGHEKAMFGIYCDGTSNDYAISVNNCKFSNTWLNGIFSGALSGEYSDCTFENCHKQTSPTGGGQIDVLSNGNHATHAIKSCLFKTAGGSDVPAIETYDCYALIEGNNIFNTGGNYSITIQSSLATTIIGNNFYSNAGPVLINESSCCNIISNRFDREGTPVVCQSDNAASGTIVGNFINATTPTSVVNFTGSRIPIYFVKANGRGVTETINGGGSKTFVYTRMQYCAMSFIVHVNDNAYTMSISEFNDVTFDRTPSDLSISATDTTFTITNTSSGEKRVIVEMI